MRAPSRSVLVLAALLTVALAGCVQETTPEGAQEGAEPRFVEIDGQQYRLNQWLLGSEGVRTSRAGSGSEPAILVTSDGSTILIGDTRGIYRSTNDGRTWTLRTPTIGNVILSDGWHIAEDDTGTIYAAGLAEARLGVFESTDKGWSWDLVTYLPDAAGVLPDRPWIAARGDGQVMLVYNNVPSGNTYCLQSFDGGLTWPDQSPFAGGVIAGNLVFDSDGSAYFADFDGEVHRKSPWAPGGVSQQCFGWASWQAVSPGSLGANNLLQVAADDGDVYMPFADSANDIQLAGSRGFGIGSTQKMIRLSDPVLKTNTFATVAAEDGRIAVAWYGTETNGDPTSSGFRGTWNVYVAVVDGFWTADPDIRHYRVSDKANHLGPICMDGVFCETDRDLLDYFMVDLGPDGDVHVGYAHDSWGSNADSYYAHVANP